MFKRLVTLLAFLIFSVLVISFLVSYDADTWVTESRQSGFVKTRMHGTEWVESLEYDNDGRLLRYHWRDAADRPCVTTYDVESGDALSIEVMPLR